MFIEMDPLVSSLSIGQEGGWFGKRGLKVYTPKATKGSTRARNDSRDTHQKVGHLRNAALATNVVSHASMVHPSHSQIQPNYQKERQCRSCLFNSHAGPRYWPKVMFGLQRDKARLPGCSLHPLGGRQVPERQLGQGLAHGALDPRRLQRSYFQPRRHAKQTRKSVGAPSLSSSLGRVRGGPIIGAPESSQGFALPTNPNQGLLNEGGPPSLQQ